MDGQVNRGFTAIKVMDWFKEDVFKLIDLYRDRPCLWDNDHVDRRDKTKKDESWNEISDILHVERMEVERKMKSLSTQFYREYKRKMKIEAETGSNEGFRSKWFAYERLSFLSRRVKERCNIYFGSEEVENGASGDDGLVDIKFHQMVDDNFSNSDQQCFPMEDIHPPKPNLKRKYSQDSYYEESFHNSKSFGDRDEFQIFGEFIACKLRNISSPLLRSVVQHRISDVIYEAEIGNFNHLVKQLPNNSIKD